MAPIRRTKPSSTTHTIQLRALDGRGGVSSRSFAVRVEDETNNHPPTLSGTPITQTIVDHAYRSQFQAVDLDDDWLNLVSSRSSVGHANHAQGELTWRPTASQVGTHAVRVEVADPYGGIDQRTY